MYNWRFLILAFLAALHPISSFSELNSVNGKGQCCDNEPTNLLRETKLSYGSRRLWQTSAKDNRLKLNRDISKNRRHEIDFSVLQRSTGDRQIADRRSERETRQISRESFRFARDDMRRAEIREGDRRQREFTSVENDAHRITSRDISRLDRDRVRGSRAILTRPNNEQNRVSKESRRESQNRDAPSEFRYKENRETRNLLQREGDDVLPGDRRNQQIRLSRSLERRVYRSRNMETRHELNRNEFTLYRDRDFTPRMSRSLERNDHKTGDRVETSEKFSRNEHRINRERDSTYRMTQSSERRDHRVRDRTAARDEFGRSERRLSTVDRSQDHVSGVSRETINERRVRDFSPKSRVVDTNQRMVRKRSIELSSIEPKYEIRDMERHQVAERLNERVLSSRQDNRVRLESRSGRRALNDNDRRATREMTNYRVQRSRSESRQMDQLFSDQHDRRMYERDMDERLLRSRSLHMGFNRERGSVARHERERNSANRDRNERRVSRINARRSLDEDHSQFLDRRERERDSVDRLNKRESRFIIRAVRSSPNGNLRQTEDSRPRERDSVSHARDEIRYARINARRVRESLDENRYLSLDGRERDSADRLRNERTEYRDNLREVQRVRDEGERQSFRRATVINALQNREQLSRTVRIRDNRQESREKRSQESIERSRNIQLESRDRSTRHDDRESRGFERRQRTIISVSGSRNLNNDVRIDARTENRPSRNLERDNYRFRSDVRYDENRYSFVLQYKTQEAENISTLNWQYLFYTLQAIYLCGIFAKMLTKDETGNKTRSVPWWTGPSLYMVKLD